MLKNRKILLGITGSIAAYKAPYIVRLLIKAGAEVKVVMTKSAKDFVSKLTLSTLSKNPVLTDLFDEESWANHVMLGRWADLMLIAPVSCNTLSKMAQGQCDNLLLATYFSATCPVALAPAMDEDMWRHPATQKNIERLKSFGIKIIPVHNGELASGLFGDGRMAEPEEIIQYVTNTFFLPKKLAGKKALISAGPTYEPIDPVRFIGNHSSGKMGIAIAKELQYRGAQVTLVTGPIQNGLSTAAIKTIAVTTAQEMYDVCMAEFDDSDITVMAAAIADFTPVNISKEKIKKSSDNLILELKKTKDILKTLGYKKKVNQVLVGFALETNNEKENTLKKLQEKKADLLILNSLRDAGAGFGHDTNKITIFSNDGKEFPFEQKSKSDVARDIVDTIIHLYYE
ncbi:MAG: bifunctional phosphopantothenoylcysteine decarboxylase/phosphopantothenate--cysteine ligase CoaBC [Bacteroidetes bacterium]|nr:bifunctional phosphopantothenoylcysteine decarboxylase/phosphopantothenate--cysteine ligase CoaBC [Bacteroidota bacterium]MBS1931472.1 bifunctional phosphopantothenoylcysteine decarboxylase/phosphopantothenate--cysteine ligase CoaBC [Bacteroidota bacterium]